MIAEDVVLQLASSLPRYTDLFTTNFDVISVTTLAIGQDLQVTVDTSVDHGLQVDQGITIFGAITPLAINSFTRAGTIGTIVTDQPHDFTFGNSGAISGTGQTNAITVGANESEFNGSFRITSVPDRNTIVVDLADAGPVSGTGPMQLENGSSSLQTYNGLQRVLTIPTSTSFTYLIQNGATLLSPNGEIKVRANARISAAVSLETIVDAYTTSNTELPQDQLWAFVVLEDVIASKDRKILSDATDNIQRSNYFRQQIIQPVTIYVVFPTAIEQIAGRRSRDLAESTFVDICKSILFKRFDPLLATGQYNPLQFLSHGFSFYNGAYYIHQYSFEQVADITFDDTVGYDEDVAFRDIDLIMGVDVGTAQLTASINLDEDNS